MARFYVFRARILQHISRNVPVSKVKKGFVMRLTILPAAALAAVFAVAMLSSPVAAMDRNEGLVIDVKPRSWLDAGNVAPVSHNRDYVTNTGVFGGSPTNGISGRGEGNLPTRGLSGRGIAFEFLGANVLR